MTNLFQAILPSGRAIRFCRMRTRDYLTIQQRVAVKVGARKDPGNGIAKALFVVEVLATCLRSITEPLAWKYLEVQDEPERDVEGDLPDVLDLAFEPGARPATSTRHEVDVDAMLADADDQKAWRSLTYAELTLKNGPLSIEEVLGELADFEACVAHVTNPATGEKAAMGASLLGKVSLVVSSG